MCFPLKTRLTGLTQTYNDKGINSSTRFTHLTLTLIIMIMIRFNTFIINLVILLYWCSGTVVYSCVTINRMFLPVACSVIRCYMDLSMHNNCTVLYCTVQYCILLYCTALLFTILNCTALYCPCMITTRMVPKIHTDSL